MSFSMSGAWMGPTPEEFQRWPAVNAALAGLPIADPGRQLRIFLVAHRVEAVVAAEGAGPLPAALGIKPIEVGGVSVYQVPRSMAATISDQTVDRARKGRHATMVRRSARRWRTLPRCGPRPGKSESCQPARNGIAARIKMGSQARSGSGRRVTWRLCRTLDWTGPEPNAGRRVVRIAAAAGSLAARYRTLGDQHLYPYPLRFPGALPRDHRIGFCL